MCLECYQGPDESILKEIISFSKSKKNKIFLGWNTTSVQFIMYSAIGLHNKKIQEMGIQILRQYANWLYDTCRYALYLPKTGLEYMYKPLLLLKFADYCETLENLKEEHNKDEYETRLKDAFEKFFFIDKELAKNKEYLNDFILNGKRLFLKYTVGSLWIGSLLYVGYNKIKSS